MPQEEENGVIVECRKLPFAERASMMRCIQEPSSVGARSSIKRLFRKRSHDRIDAGISAVLRLLGQRIDRISGRLLDSENLRNGARFPGEVGDRELLADRICEIGQVKNPGGMSSSSAPHGSGIPHVGPKKTRDADTPFALLNRRQQAPDCIGELLIGRRLDENIQAARHNAERGKHHAMDDGGFGNCAAGARDRSASRHEVFEIVLFVFGDKALMKAAIEQALHCRIDVALQRTLQQFVEFTALRRRQAEFAERLEAAAVFLRREDFPADESKASPSRRADEPVASAAPDRFLQEPADFRQASCRTRRTRSPRHSCALPCGPRGFRCRDCAKAGHNPRHRCRAQVPRRAHPEQFRKADAPFVHNCRIVRRIVSFIPMARRMVVSAVHNRDPRMPVHEQFKDAFAVRSHACDCARFLQRSAR